MSILKFNAKQLDVYASFDRNSFTQSGGIRYAFPTKALDHLICLMNEDPKLVMSILTEARRNRPEDKRGRPRLKQ